MVVIISKIVLSLIGLLQHRSLNNIQLKCFRAVGISRKTKAGNICQLVSYLIFWGPVTCLLILHLLNNSPFQSHNIVSIANCMGVLVVWNLLLAFFMFVMGKAVGNIDVSFREVID
jgi:hypothetical protein